MAYTQKIPLSERPPKRRKYERPYGGKITPIIKFRDPNQEPRVKHQHTSGKIRRDKSKPIFCEWCGEQIPELEIKTQRKNRKFHKACKEAAYRGKPRTSWKDSHNSVFIEAFDNEFNLQPIEAKGGLNE